MSHSSLYERTIALEQPVTVILMDGEKEKRERKWSGKRGEKIYDDKLKRSTVRYKDIHRDKEKDGRTVEIIHVGIDSGNTMSSLSTDFTTDDRSLVTDDRSHFTDDRPRFTDHRSQVTGHRSHVTDHRSLATVNVIVDDDDRARHNTSGDMFLSGDDSVSNVGLQGHVTKREMEVVEHETTRKSVILAPNTKLDSDEDLDHEELDHISTMLAADMSEYDAAAARYHSAFKGKGSLLPVVVFKTDSETQTSRNRTTQTGIDQSTQTEKKKRRKIAAPEPHPNQPRRTPQRLNLEHRLSSINEDQDWIEDSEATYHSQDTYGKTPSNGLYDDYDSSTAVTMTTGTRILIEKVSVGHQTASHSATQTPVLVKLDNKGGYWVPQDAVGMLTSLDATGQFGSGRYFCPLGSRETIGDAEDSSLQTRDFATQTFGQMLGQVVNSQTQTIHVHGHHGHGIHGNDVKDERDERGTSKEETNRRRSTDSRTHSGAEGRTERKVEKVRKHSRVKETDPKEDDSKRDILKLMLHEIKALKRRASEQEMDGRNEGGKDERRRRRSRHRHHGSRNRRSASSGRRAETLERIRHWTEDRNVRRSNRQPDELYKDYYSADEEYRRSRKDLESLGRPGGTQNSAQVMGRRNSGLGDRRELRHSSVNLLRSSWPNHQDENYHEHAGQRTGISSHVKEFPAGRDHRRFRPLEAKSPSGGHDLRVSLDPIRHHGNRR